VREFHPQMNEQNQLAVFCPSLRELLIAEGCMNLPLLPEEITALVELMLPIGTNNHVVPKDVKNKMTGIGKSPPAEMSEHDVHARFMKLPIDIRKAILEAPRMKAPRGEQLKGEALREAVSEFVTQMNHIKNQMAKAKRYHETKQYYETHKKNEAAKKVHEEEYKKYLENIAAADCMVIKARCVEIH
jgi:hypothetical protein